MSEIQEHLIDRLDALSISAEWGSLGLEIGEFDSADMYEMRLLTSEITDRYNEVMALLVEVMRETSR